MENPPNIQAGHFVILFLDKNKENNMRIFLALIFSFLLGLGFLNGQVNCVFIGAKLSNIDTTGIRMSAPNGIRTILIGTNLNDAVPNAENIQVLYLKNNKAPEIAITEEQMLRFVNVYSVVLPEYYSKEWAFFIDHLYLLPSLRHIVWNHNPIPNTIGKFGLLEKLEVSRPNTALQISISQMAGLKHLHIFGANDRNDSPIEISDAICRIPQLQSLEITDLNFTGLTDSIHKLKHLKSLRLTNSQMKSLNKNICLLDSLEDLSLIYTGEITGDRKQLVLPEKIGALKNLKHFTLFGIAVPGLPESFSELPKLESIQISSDYFTEFPLQITRLKSPLKRIVFDARFLKILPDEIGKLGNANTNSSPEGILYLENCSLLVSLPEGIKNMRMALELDNPLALEDISALDKLDHPFTLIIDPTPNLNKLLRSLKNHGKNLILLIHLAPKVPKGIERLDKLLRLEMSFDMSESKINKSKKRLKRKLPDTVIVIKNIS